METYIEADRANFVTDRRSTSGYCTFIGGNLVTWRRKKQLVVTRSSMAQGIYELLWIRMMLFDLGMNLEGRMKLYCNNMSNISITHNLVHYDWPKHVEIDWHFIKEKLENREILIPYVASKGQLADFLIERLLSSTI